MKTSRRAFLRNAGAFGAFNLLPAGVIYGASAPSNQLTRVLIGYGAVASAYDVERNIGTHMKPAAKSYARIVGICDPYADRVKKGVAKAAEWGYGKIKGCRDFREFLADPGVDIVHICTPPHWHGVQSVMAANAGKDIWCEKPMTRTVGEGKRVMELVKAKGRMFTLNTCWRYRWPFYGFGTTVKPIRQVVANGLVSSPGKPIRCVIGAGQGFDWKFFWSGRVNLDPQPTPDPAVFDWDMWLGPAPWKPYNRHRALGTFRGYWDYDGGGLGDMAQHYLDPVQYILGKDDTSPVKVDYIGPKQHPDVVGRFDRITLTYADGTEVILDGNRSLMNEPFMRGDKTSLWPVRNKKGEVDLWTEFELAGKQMFTMTDNQTGKKLDAWGIVRELPEPPPQQTDFGDSVRTRKRFCINEETGFRSCTMFNLAIVAERLGRGFRFDPVTLRAVDDPAADRFLYQSMREPWAGEFMKG